MIAMRWSCSAGILGLRVRLRTPQMVEILTSDVRLGVISGGEPDLGQVGLTDIVGRARAAHLGRHPAGLQRVREDAAPTPGNGEGEHRIMELTLGIGRGRRFFQEMSSRLALAL